MKNATAPANAQPSTTTPIAAQPNTSQPVAAPPTATHPIVAAQRVVIDGCSNPDTVGLGVAASSIGAAEKPKIFFDTLAN